MGLTSGNVSILATWDCICHENSRSLCSGGGRRRHSRAGYCSHVSCHDLCIVVCLFRLLFWECGKLSKGWFFKYLLNRGRDDSLENGGMQELMDYAWWAFWWLSVGVVFLCGNNLWHIEEFEHWSLTFMVNYSYSGAVLEETKMHCSSETVVPIWDFECERALLNLGFARSFKVSRFDNILFLSSFISEN